MPRLLEQMRVFRQAGRGSQAVKDTQLLEIVRGKFRTMKSTAAKLQRDLQDADKTKWYVFRSDTNTIICGRPTNVIPRTSCIKVDLTNPFLTD